MELTRKDIEIAVRNGVIKAVLLLICLSIAISIFCMVCIN